MEMIESCLKTLYGVFINPGTALDSTDQVNIEEEIKKIKAKYRKEYKAWMKEYRRGHNMDSADSSGNEPDETPRVDSTVDL